MQDRAAIRKEALRLRSLFEKKGAQPVETDILQPAAALLDLYGEDIRARAFVTVDSQKGELMLRPDFTVPVAQMHMEHGAESACYTYAGEVFRRQNECRDRPIEYFQVGIELFHRGNPAYADARVFSSIYSMLGNLRLKPAIGDIGILMSAVEGLSTINRRKRALMRHIWRPGRFRTLLDRYSGRMPVPNSRAELLASKDPMSNAGQVIGLRTASEITERIEALREDAATKPLPEHVIELLDEILEVGGKPEASLKRLREIELDMPVIVPAVDGLEKRLEAIENCGIDLNALVFEASYGRTQMEYYDGFVFGFYSERYSEMPPVASGGRYDALTRRLGRGRMVPAVGGVIRPGLTLELEREG
ncbi:MAG: ATP phosphoribosyltransferase regulatory subunit [Roseovarius sp.]|nr:ATP phosphoribosyltransferase regulatory subunit [Roseovarius sp.]